MKDSYKLKYTYQYLEDEWANGYWDFIQNNFYSNLDWKIISHNLNITWDIIQSNPDIKWDWGEISRNPSITLDIIQSNPDKEWDWYWLSDNPNITWEIIKALQIQRHWRNCSYNPEYKLTQKLVKNRII